MSDAPLSLRVLACEVAQREIGHLAADCPNLLELEFLPVGHHDAPKEGNKDLQARIDAAPASTYDAILLGYGMCSAILTGLTARHTPLVVPRAHDCITLFLGAKERYTEVFQRNPGTYYFTAGWLDFPRKRALRQGGLAALGAMPDAFSAQASPFALDKTFAQLVAQYGEENARYLVEVGNEWSQHYACGALVELDCTRGLNLRSRVKSICQQRGWRFESIPGDLGLLRRWLAGDWNDTDFLVVPPGHRILPTYNDRIIEAAPEAPAVPAASPSAAASSAPQAPAPSGSGSNP